MTAGRQHEPAGAAEELGAAVAALPWRDVVGDAGDDVGVHGDPAEVDRGAEDGQGPGPGERVLHRQVHEVGVQCCGHPGGVGVPEQDVERGRSLAEQVVVDPVVPHQVAGPQPREHLGQVPAIEVPRARRPGLGPFRQPRVDQGSHRPGVLVVDHRHCENEPGQPLLLPDGGEVARCDAREDAAGAGPTEHRLRGAGDLLDGVEGVQDAAHVGVQVPGGVPRIRVAPGDEEHLPPLPDAELHQAPVRGEVECVELVDGGWDHQRRHLEDLVGLRRVLDQLQHLVAEHDPAGRRGDVVSQDEAAAIDHLRKPRRGQVRCQLPAPAHQAQPRAVDRCLGRGRVDQRYVARSGRLGDVLDQELHALAVSRVEISVDEQLLGRLAAGQVELDQPLQQGVLGPGDVGEPAVATTRHQGRGAGQDAAGLDTELAQPPRGDARRAGEGDRPPRGGHVRDESADRAERGVNQQGVEWGSVRAALGSGHRRSSSWSSGATCPACHPAGGP